MLTADLMAARMSAFEAHSGLPPDIAPFPKSAKSGRGRYKSRKEKVAREHVFCAKKKATRKAALNLNPNDLESGGHQG
jgi:hypothetical protein